MKKQNNNKLDFRKHTLVELNDDQLQDINGGSTFLCGLSITIGSIVASVSIVGSIIYTIATRE